MGLCGVRVFVESSQPFLFLHNDCMKSTKIPVKNPKNICLNSASVARQDA